MIKGSDNLDYKFTLRSAFEAIQWFKAKLKSLFQNNRDENKQEQQKTEKDFLNEVSPDTFEVGQMYLFHYDPLGKNTLPYYDTFPLIILMGTKRGGFYGINLHYIPVHVRMVLLSNLLGKQVLNGGELEKLRISYGIVKNETTFDAFKPCFKQYSTKQIKSSIKLIKPEDWAFAAALPIENFKKRTKQQVWEESMNSLN